MPRAIRPTIALLLCALVSSAAIAEDPRPAGDEPREREQDEQQDEQVPYWYIPGHPEDPAAASAIQTLPGFRVERVYRVPEDYGSWTALTVDPKGRLITAAQHREGLYRITPPPIGDGAGPARVEKLRSADMPVGWSHGLLHAFDSLYVMVSEDPGAGRPTGLYRLRDTDGDDQFDRAELLKHLPGAGEHGPHNMVIGHDRRSIYVICGNGVPPPDDIAGNRTVRTEGLDHLMPPGFESTRHSTAGWVARFDPDGRNWQLLCAGLRNSFDLAFNTLGDPFTFDSDMEWDLGAPWYRPTRICLLVSGGEFGWRGDAGKWPEHYEDSAPPVLNIGPASPTGLTFGYGAAFPARYQRALFALDWTFVTIHAVHLEPEGAGYRAEREQFIAGRGLPVTDAIVNPADGALYFIVGGRKLGSALYRVVYIGDQPTDPVTEPIDHPRARDLRALRRRLAAYHGPSDPAALDACWPHLGHEDRFIRYAARLAVEHQPVVRWRRRALTEPDLAKRLIALLALARQGDAGDQPLIIEHLGRIDFGGLPVDRKLIFLRTCELALARGREAARSAARPLIDRLDPHYPDPDADQRVNRELARLLCFLDAPNAVEKTLALMEADAGRPTSLGAEWHSRNDKYGEHIRDMLRTSPQPDRMHMAMMLNWTGAGWTDELRRRYFRLLSEGMEHSAGGHLYRGFWERIREAALDRAPAAQREELASIGGGAPPVVDVSKLPSPRGPGRPWTVEELLGRLRGGLEGRDYDRGRTMYHAATCIVCHRFKGAGGNVGPDLSMLGGRFTPRDIVEAIIEPNKAVSDQYRMVRVMRKDGRVEVGRITYREAEAIHLMPNMMDPATTLSIPADEVRRVEPLPLSPMPPGLLNTLNEDEVLDLLAYLISGGDPEHEVFRPAGPSKAGQGG